MTLDDVKAMTDDFITAAQAASVMKMDVGRLIGYARSGQLPFPAVISGNRVKIPRVGFLKFFGQEIEEKKKQTVIETELKELTRQIAIMNILLTAAVSKYAPTSLAIFGDQIKELEKHEPVQNIQDVPGSQDPDADDGRRDRGAGTVPHCPGGSDVHHRRADVLSLGQDGVSDGESNC